MFSNYLNELSKKYNFSFVEVFIHNTFGEKDKRNKIIPIIFNDFKKNQTQFRTKTLI